MEMKEWYDQRRILISTLEVKFLIQLLEERINLSTELIKLNEYTLKRETDTERLRELEDTNIKEKRTLIGSRGILRRFRGLLKGQKKRLREVESVACYSVIS